jgi:hypothetical protein
MLSSPGNMPIVQSKADRLPERTVVSRIDQAQAEDQWIAAQRSLPHALSGSEGLSRGGLRDELADDLAGR